MSAEPRTDGMAACILIAEDHRDSREALSALLEAMGFRVLVAVNGVEAVAVAREGGPDLILMDMMMPEMDGFNATRVLREDEDTRDLPIIAVTAMEGAQELAYAAGVDDFVRKPVDTRSLLAKIRELLDGRSG